MFLQEVIFVGFDFIVKIKNQSKNVLKNRHFFTIFPSKTNLLKNVKKKCKNIFHIFL